MSQLETTENIFLLVDGNDFKPFPVYDETTNNMRILPYVTIEGGDNLYLPIAAASILAKYTRDEYMLNLCKEDPQLSEKYGLDKNMGYGTKKHMEGIQTYGITQGHRLSYKPCKLNANLH
jgi:ribonuclease HII